jgi:hypothetical protein
MYRSDLVHSVDPEKMGRRNSATPGKEAGRYLALHFARERRLIFYRKLINGLLLTSSSKPLVANCCWLGYLRKLPRMENNEQN